MSVLEFHDVHRSYRTDEEVLSGVNLRVERGEVVGLLGRNGAGKTTMLRLALGLLEPQGGTVRAFDLDPRVRPLEVKRRTGYVSEEQVLPPFLRVGDVLDLHRDLFPDWDGALERDLRDRFEIALDARIRKLSKGQARRVTLLCAVAHRPELLLLDEPAGGLDPAARREFLETSIRLLNESGSTILFSSHYMTDVERLAERIVLLEGGRVRIDRPLDDLREEYSLLVLPDDGTVSRERVRALGSCLGVRCRRGSLHAILELDPEEARAVAARELGIREAQCRYIPLEEMFVELMGTSS